MGKTKYLKLLLLLLAKVAVVALYLAMLPLFIIIGKDLQIAWWGAVIIWALTLLAAQDRQKDFALFILRKPFTQYWRPASVAVAKPIKREPVLGINERLGASTARDFNADKGDIAS